MDLANLKRRLRAAGRTQKELADFLGVGHGEVSKYLSGRHQMRAERYLKIEAFLAEAEAAARRPGAAETRTEFADKARSLTLAEALALKANPPPKLPPEERERLIRELIELGDAYRLLPRDSDGSDEEILGYDENGVPAR